MLTALVEYVVSVNRINSVFQVSLLGGNCFVKVERHEGPLA